MSRYDKNDKYKQHGGETSRLAVPSTILPRKDRGQIKCYGCGQFGHFKNKCTNVSQADKKPSGSKMKTTNAFSAVFLTGTYSKDDWYVDSGASVHLTVNQDWVKNKVQDGIQHEIMVANQTKVTAACKGDVDVVTVVGADNN